MMSQAITVSMAEVSHLNGLYGRLNDFKEVCILGDLVIQPHLMHIAIPQGNDIVLWHKHPTFEFSLLLAGRIEYMLEPDKSVELSPGDAIVIPAELRHRWIIKEPTNVIFGFMLYLSEQNVTSRGELAQLHRNIARHGYRIANFKELQQIVKRILEVSRKSPGYLEERLRTLSVETFVELLSIFLPPAKDRRVITPPQPQPGKITAAVKLYVQDNMDRPVTPQVVAKYLGIRLNQLNIILRRESNLCVGQLIREQKFNYASRLLANTNRQIKNIAAAIGFEDVGYFCRCFKQCQSVSPAAYRCLNRNTAGAAVTGNDPVI